MTTSDTNNDQHYREGWNKVYANRKNPFDIEAVYEWVVALEESGAIRGKVLDAGCGAGHNALYLAAKGHEVVGIDIADFAIGRAIEKAKERHITNAEFLTANICALHGFDDEFDTVIDIGCFHSLDGDDPKRYAEVLYRACKKGASVYLRALSDSNRGRDNTGPKISEADIRVAFAEGWHIASLEEKEIEIELFGERIKTFARFAIIRKG